jgi:transposase
MRTQEYVVKLTPAERTSLLELIWSGQAPARKLAHARVLLKADQGPEGPALQDDEVAEAVEVGSSTVGRLRRQFVEEGLTAALNRRGPGRAYPRKLDGAAEAHLVALTCSEPPSGQVRWTLRLLADKLVELEIVPSVSYETVRRVLKKTRSSRGASDASASRPRTTGSSSGAWRTSSTSTRARTTRSGHRSAWTR